MSSKPPFPFFPYVVLPDVLAVALLALGPPLWVRTLAFAAYACAKLAGMLFYSTGAAMNDFAIGASLAQQVLMALHAVLLVCPVDDVRHEHDTFRTSARELPFFRRVIWVARYYFFPRSVGWSDQVANLPPRPRAPRWAFVRTQLLWIVWYLVVIDVSQTYLDTRPGFVRLPGDPPVSMGTDGYVLRCLDILARVLSWALMQLQYSVCAIVAVALGLSGPADWPDLFGRWADAYTVRNFWGKHGISCSAGLLSTGRLVVNTLGFKRGTNLSSYTQLYVAFVLSGLMHCGGDIVAEHARFGESFTFFFVQALAITAEDFAIWLGKRLGIKESRATRALGYAWTFAWFSWSTPLYLEVFINAGAGPMEVLPFSVCGYVGRRLGLL